MRGTPAEVRLDGKTLAQVKVAKDGRMSYTLKVGEELSLGSTDWRSHKSGSSANVGLWLCS